jgi:hypothetical protein
MQVLASLPLHDIDMASSLFWLLAEAISNCDANKVGVSFHLYVRFRFDSHRFQSLFLCDSCLWVIELASTKSLKSSSDPLCRWTSFALMWCLSWRPLATCVASCLPLRRPLCRCCLGLVWPLTSRLLRGASVCLHRRCCSRIRWRWSL